MAQRNLVSCWIDVSSLTDAQLARLIVNLAASGEYHSHRYLPDDTLHVIMCDHTWDVLLATQDFDLPMPVFAS